jgi:hypothetical protein
VKKKTPYWWKVIEQAKARKRSGAKAFTNGQLKKADQWPDCACGKQDPAIPRTGHGQPLDSALFVLGCDFADAVEGGYPSKAGKILRAIETRSAEILRELPR